MGTYSYQEHIKAGLVVATCHFQSGQALMLNIGGIAARHSPLGSRHTGFRRAGFRWGLAQFVKILQRKSTKNEKKVRVDSTG